MKGKWIRSVVVVLVLTACVACGLIAAFLVGTGVRVPWAIRPTVQSPGQVATNALATIAVRLTQSALLPTPTPVTATQSTTPTILPTQVETATPSPTATTANPTQVTTTPVSTEEFRFACVDDNSTGSGEERDYLQECQSALEAAYPESRVVKYAGCDPGLLGREFDGVVMDYQMSGSIDGPSCIRAILNLHPETAVIGWAEGRLDELTGAGARAACMKPDVECVINAFEILDP